MPPLHESHENAHDHKHKHADEHANEETVAGGEVRLCRESIDRQRHCHTESHACRHQSGLSRVLSANKAEKESLTHGEDCQQDVVGRHCPGHVATADYDTLGDEGDEKESQG